MRFSKIMLVSIISIAVLCFILCLSLFITYNARLTIIGYLAEEQFSAQKIEITCLDLDITKNMSLVVKQLCIKSPKANIEINNTQVQWQYSPKLAITHVDVSLINVIGADHLLANTQDSTSNKTKSLDQLLSETLSSYAEQIAQFELPLSFTIHQLTYQPFPAEQQTNASQTNASQTNTPQENTQQKNLYFASLSGENNTITFSVSAPNKIEFINTHLTTTDKGFTLALLSDLQLLKDLAMIHQLPITDTLQQNLNELALSGSLHTTINYQAEKSNNKKRISSHHQLINFTLRSTNGIDKSGPFTLSSSLNFQTKLNLTHETDNSNETLIEVSFLPSNQVEQNEVILDYSQKHLLNWLQESKILTQESTISADIVTLLNDNPTDRLIVDLNSTEQDSEQDKSTITVNDNQISVDASKISVSAQHNVNTNLDRKRNKPVHQVILDDVLFTYPINWANNVSHTTKVATKKTTGTLAVEHFTINSRVKIANIVEIIKAPISINLSGSLYKNDQQIDLTLDNDSVIIAKNFIISKHKQHKNKSKQISTETEYNKKNSSTNTKTSQPALSTLPDLSTLTTKLNGQVHLLANNAITLDIKMHNQAAQLNIPKILQIKSSELRSNIKGNLDNIQVNTVINADGVNIGNINITGPALSPTVQMSVANLALTDLLALNVKLPINIELIDGRLDYNIIGRITDLTNASSIENTPFNANISIASVSGEFDGIWLQELNWQQSFTLLNGEITTQPNNTVNKSENLTIALIDTPTPVSKISLNTNWTYNKDFELSLSQFKGQILGGSYTLPKIQWPLKNGHSVNVQLSSIDLEQVVALDKKQGIVVTGQISGELPINYNDGKYTIENGKLHNDSNGLIQVIDNPAVAELSASNNELQVAFEALENLHYHQLFSDVSMKEDGYMILDTVIKGRNPDIDNDVNLNLNLTYDLIGLLKSISITERFEQELIKGIQH